MSPTLRCLETSPRVEALAHRMPDVDFLFLLTVAVDPAVALLHDVGIPWNLDMDQVIAVILEVDSFRSGIGRQQDSDRRHVRMCLEGRLDRFALVGPHASMENHQPVAAVSVGGQNLMEPDMGGSILREKNHPLVVPAPAGLQMCVEPVEDGFRLRVHPVLVSSRPNP